MSNSSELVVREVVYLDDPNYFCNKSWTLSFNVNTKSWVSFHSYIPNWYIGENNFFYSGLNPGCDLHAIAVQEVPATTTTTTTYIPDCDLAGTAEFTNTTTTTTSTSTSTSTTTTTSTSTSTSTTTSTTTQYSCIDKGGCFSWTWTAGESGGLVTWIDCNGNPASNALGPDESGGGCMCDIESPSATGIVIGPTQGGSC
jgi:hypothetical protein